MKEILVVSHCILNKASKVAQDELDLAEEYQLRDLLLHLVLDKDVQLIQLPCPEFILYGSRRWGHVMDQFMHPHFRRESEAMLTPVVDQLEEYAGSPGRFRIIGIVSVEGSPSCGYHLTCRAGWYGEIGYLGDADELSEGLRMEEQPGAFMAVLDRMLQDRKLDIPVMTLRDAVRYLEEK